MTDEGRDIVKPKDCSDPTWQSTFTGMNDAKQNGTGNKPLYKNNRALHSMAINQFPLKSNISGRQELN